MRIFSQKNLVLSSCKYKLIFKYNILYNNKFILIILICFFLLHSSVIFGLNKNTIKYNYKFRGKIFYCSFENRSPSMQLLADGDDSSESGEFNIWLIGDGQVLVL